MDRYIVTAREKILGYFMGSIAVMVMNSILSNYLNVYYTDVLKIGGIWGGMFISLFPIVAKVLDVLTFIFMGLVVDRTKSRQGKARPWIFTSYTIFYAVAFTMYSTAHTLLVPLATSDPVERQQLSTVANTPGMAAGSFVAILFPCIIVPFMGVSGGRWIVITTVLAFVSLPLILMEFFFTRERITEAGGAPEGRK